MKFRLEVTVDLPDSALGSDAVRIAASVLDEVEQTWPLHDRPRVTWRLLDRPIAEGATE